MKTVMIVDDEIDVIEKVKSFLEDEDYKVVTATNSRKALELIDGDKEDDFGLILIDTSIPSSEKSSLFSMKPKSKIKMDNMDDFLQKPFTKEQLLEFVKKRI